jgi:hypothetical protein
MMRVEHYVLWRARRAGAPSVSADNDRLRTDGTVVDTRAVEVAHESARSHAVGCKGPAARGVACLFQSVIVCVINKQSLATRKYIRVNGEDGGGGGVT